MRSATKHLFATVKDAAVLMVTHDPQEAMKVADEIALMRDGKILQRGAPYNIYNAPVDLKGFSFFQMQILFRQL